MTELKTLHEFEINELVEVDETETQKDENGKEIKVTKKVSKTIPRKLAIRKPTRSMQDNGDLYFSVQVSKAIKEGVLTRAMLAKYIKNVDGILSEKEKEYFTKITEDLLTKNKELEKLIYKDQKNITEEEKKKEGELIKDINSLSGELSEFQSQQSELFNNTAENIARTKTIAWWVVNLSYLKNEKNEWAEFFGDGDLDSKLNKYDELIENENPFFLEALQRFILYITLWYNGSASESKDFVAFEEQLK